MGISVQAGGKHTTNYKVRMRKIKYLEKKHPLHLNLSKKNEKLSK